MPQQVPLLLPPPAIARDAETNDVIINAHGRTEIHLARVVRTDPARCYWEITVLHRKRVRAVTTSIGKLPTAIFHALIACMNIGLLQPPPRVQRKWCARRFWYIRERTGRETMQLSCRCGYPCMQHRPLLVLTTVDDTFTTLCLGRHLVTDDAFAMVQFVAEQLIARRYLR